MPELVTIKDLYESGRISFYISKKALKGKGKRKELVTINEDCFVEWGNVVRIGPSDITLQLHETRSLDTGKLNVNLWPDKPLDLIVVENEPLCNADNSGFVRNVRMGSYFYTISMNPINYKDKEFFGIKVYRIK